MIDLSKKDGILSIRFSNPEKHNAVGVAEYTLLADTLNESNDDAELIGIVISSEGKTFCAGNKLDEFQTEWPQPDHGSVFAFLNAIASAKLPIVALIQGGAVGVGATMLLHCDIVVMSDKAFLKYPFVPIGISPEGGSSRILPILLGRAKAMEIFLTGRKVMADEAHRLGLCSQVVAHDDLCREAERWIEILNAPPAGAIAATKRLIQSEFNMPMSEYLEHEIQTINSLLRQRRS